MTFISVVHSNMNDFCDGKSIGSIYVQNKIDHTSNYSYLVFYGKTQLFKAAFYPINP